ncbi:hypothetical protein MKX03_012505 [Papaver bracteatum]|nr:hypothetical protein MKX03_012505 [Papaver bracteatum]
MAETLILHGTLVDHNDMVTAIACLIDNLNMIVSSSRDKSILVWTLNEKEGNYGVPKFRLTVSGSWDGELRLWDLSTGVTAHTFIVAFATDNTEIVSASRDRSIKVWNTLGECKHTIQDGDSHTNCVSCVRFIPETLEPTIVSASWDKTVKLWNLTNCTLRNNLAGHGGHVRALFPFHLMVRYVQVVVLMMLFCFRIWLRVRNWISLDAGGMIHGLCFNPNRYCLCAAIEEVVKIWDLETRSRFYCSSVNWSSDGSSLFTGYTNGTIRVWGY